MTKSRKLAYAALIYNAIIWGGAFPVVKPVFDLLSPMQYLYLRYLLAGLLSLPIFFHYYYKKHPNISYMIKSWLLELAGLAFPILILYEGLKHTSALEASLIGATGPIFVVIGGVLFLRERETKREWQGLALSLLGSCILILEPLWAGHALVGSSLYGNLLILFYNLVWAVYAIVAKRFYKTRPPLTIGALTYLGTAMIYGLILTSQDQLLPIFENLRIWDSRILFPVLYMAIPGGIIANIFYLYAQSKIEVSEANLFTYLNGVVAIPAAFLLLGEKPTWLTLLAISVIGYGVLRAELRKK